jgi:hypothetical protein
MGQQSNWLNYEILHRLDAMLRHCNPFIGIYTTAHERFLAQNGPFRILLSLQMRLIMETGADRRRENLPTANEVALVIPDEFENGSRCDIVVALCNPSESVCNGGGDGRHLKRVHVTHAAYMPLHYVLLFLKGDLGYHYEMEIGDRNGVWKQRRLKQRVFYCYWLHPQDLEPSLLFYRGWLL